MFGRHTAIEHSLPAQARWSSKAIRSRRRVVLAAAADSHGEDRPRRTQRPGLHGASLPSTWGQAMGTRMPCSNSGERRRTIARSIPSLMPALPLPVEAIQNLIPAVIAAPTAIWASVCGFFLANFSILGASASASFKLFVLILSIGWMVSTGRLPEATAPVMSKVGFNLIIPCMLMSKVATTLTNDASWALAGIPLAALLQIIAGAIIGRVASIFVLGEYPEKLRILGYHPSDPPPAAAAIAASTAAAMALPQVAQQLIPKPKEPPQGLRQLVQLSCAFGNSLTLPLVFLFALLPDAAANQSVAFVALFLAGWSPCLWSIGYDIMGSACAPASASKNASNISPGARNDMLNGDTSSMSDPVTPLVISKLNMSSSSSKPNDTNDDAFGGADPSMTIDVSLTSDGGGSSLSTDSADDSDDSDVEATPPKSKFNEVREQISVLWSRFVNPPIAGIFAGLFLGLSPVGAFLLLPTTPALTATIGSYSLELQLMIHMGRAAMEVAVMLGGATLAVQAVVLAASMQPPKEDAANEAINVSFADNRSDIPSILTTPPPIVKKGTKGRALLKLLFPSDPLEKRCLAAVLVARMLLMPMVGIGIVTAMSSVGLLPDDPICRFAILLQSAMPTAQNLVLLLQLREETQPLASGLALLLLRTYLFSIVPLALWITLFMKVAKLTI